MTTFNFGLVGNPKVSFSVPSTQSERDEAETAYHKNGGDYGAILKGIVFASFKKRMTQQGAEDTRYFPIN